MEISLLSYYGNLIKITLNFSSIDVVPIGNCSELHKLLILYCNYISISSLFNYNTVVEKHRN